MISRNLFFLIIAYACLVSLLVGCGPSECKPKSRYLVVYPYAGLANRLRVLASAKILAAATDRHLVVDWPVIRNEIPAKWHELFLTPMTMFEQSSLKNEGCTLSEIKSAPPEHPVIKNVGAKNDYDEAKGLSKIAFDDEPIIYFGTSVSFFPEEEIMPYSEYQERYRTFYKNLDPVLWVNQAVKEFRQQHSFDKKFMIGVHYRSWATSADNYSRLNRDRENRYLQEFVDEMKRALKKPLHETKQKPVAFFLATDDKGVKEKLLAVPELADRIFTRDIEIDRSTVKGQQNALVDWFLLGGTNYIIGTYQSSFSDEAAYLTKENRKVNIGEAAFKPKDS